MIIAVIDTGTTNTRIYLWKDDLLVSEAATPIGVRNTAIDGNNHKLLKAIRDALYESTQKIGTCVDAIELIVAAGMLTSNLGIYEVAHITAPGGLDELAAGMVKVHLPEICQQPIWLIPGMKNMEAAALREDTVCQMDIMRGEETEAMGILTQQNVSRAAVFVLPGSHHKYIAVSAQGKMKGCMTTISGELLYSLTFDTILADSVERSFAVSFLEEAFWQGVASHQKVGFAHAAFMGRILSLFLQRSPLFVQNYILGLILAEELAALRKSQLLEGWEKAAFYIAGKPVIQQAYQSLLRQNNLQPVLLELQEQHELFSCGAIAIARRRGLLEQKGGAAVWKNC